MLPCFLGIPIVVFYLGDLAREIVPSWSQTFPIFLHLDGAIASLFTMRVVESYGWKTLIQFGIVGMSTLSSLIGLGYLWNNDSPFIEFFVLLALVFFRLIFSISIGPVVWFYIAEIVQPNIVPYTTMINFASGSTIAVLFPIVTNIWLGGNPGFLFICFAAYGAASYLLCQRIVIESQNKTEY